MEYGVATFATDNTIQPVALGQAVQAAGFESLWLAEHSHIPTSRRTPWGGRQGAPPLPEWYWRSHDIFVALSAIAATTSTLRLGTGIALVAQRDPIWLAKQVASLDVVSEGRVNFGIGYGWNIEEMESHGANTDRRRAVVREKVLAMKEIWSRDEAEFHGAYVEFEPLWSWPKPLQQPHPPIVIGGPPTPVTFRHVVEYADGWMPILGRFPIIEHITELRRQAEDADRDPASIDIGVYWATPKPDVLETLADAGVDFALFPLESVSEAETVERLGSMSEVAKQVG